MNQIIQMMTPLMIKTITWNFLVSIAAAAAMRNSSNWSSALNVIHSSMLGGLFVSYVLLTSTGLVFKRLFKTAIRTAGSARWIAMANTLWSLSQKCNFCVMLKQGGTQSI